MIPCEDASSRRTRVRCGTAALYSFLPYDPIVPLVPPNFATHYEELKQYARANVGGANVRTLLMALATEGYRFLTSECEPVTLTSQVAQKSYGAFRHRASPSRPVCLELFPASDTEFSDAIAAFDADRGALSPAQVTRSIYAVAMAFCAANDAAKSNDRKTPATFFEILAGHLVASFLGVQPRRSIPVLHMDEDHVELPTDYWFDLGPEQQKIHLPVKMSTRERAIQVWAHQRILDGVFGTSRLIGVLIALAETKLSRRTLDVVEICVPGQWQLYQRYIAPIHRVYYLDPPAAYLALNPEISVRSIGQLFGDLNDLRTTTRQ